MTALSWRATTSFAKSAQTSQTRPAKKASLTISARGGVRRSRWDAGVRVLRRFQVARPVMHCRAPHLSTQDRALLRPGSLPSRMDFFSNAVAVIGAATGLALAAFSAWYLMADADLPVLMTSVPAGAFRGKRVVIIGASTGSECMIPHVMERDAPGRASSSRAVTPLATFGPTVICSPPPARSWTRPCPPPLQGRCCRCCVLSQRGQAARAGR